LLLTFVIALNLLNHLHKRCLVLLLLKEWISRLVFNKLKKQFRTAIQ